MKIGKIFIIIPFFLGVMLSNAQNTYVGDWSSLLPYKRGVSVTESDDNIIYATPYSIFTINKQNFNFESYDKTNGLSDVGVKFVRYDDSNKQLIIFYQNNNIDIIRNGETYNIPDIKINESILGTKTINDVFISDDVAYLACSFGVVEFRLKKLEFGSTIFTSENVKSITRLGDNLVALFNDEVYYIDLSSSINISDFSNWQMIEEDFGYDVVSVESLGDELYVFSRSEIYSGTLSDDFTELDNFIAYQYEIEFTRETKGQIVVGAKKNNSDIGRIYSINSGGQVAEGSTTCNNLVTDALIDDQGRYWYGDQYRFIRYTDTFGGECKRIDNPSFLTGDVSDIATRGNDVFVASGGAAENYAVNSNRSGLFARINNDFINYNEYSLPAMQQADFANVYQVEVHPRNSLVYMGSYYNGIIELNTKTNETRYFSTENSALQHAKNETDGERISGLDFDLNNNLWINNIFAPRPIVVYTNSGEWYSYKTSTDGFIAQITADHNGYVWNVVVGSSGGLYVHDVNNTFEDTSDDRSLLINKNNSALRTSNINCITVDQDGEIWVGTDEGPVIFNSTTDLFERATLGSRLKVDLDGNVNFLLSEEDVRSIAIDGANRKWIGTRNGIFVMSPNGKEQIENYTTENSPLFSNNIIDLEMSDDGVMYIGTDNGVQSFRTSTSVGNRRHNKKDVYAFPNPVSPDYKGDIFIKGLASDSYVKITDINGNLVKEIRAQGGLATWDGTNLNGSQVASGVYLVFSTAIVDFDNTDSFVTKIMVVR